MDTKHRDFLVGLFIVVTVGIIAGAIIITSGLGQAHRDLYMRLSTAQDLNTDTRVLLQGLAVGRVRQINPRVDSATGRLHFVALLSIDERFPDGSRLELPRGTTGLISQPTLAAPVIDLVTPTTPNPVPLSPGDTIDSQRKTSTVDQMGEVATKLSTQVASALEDTRHLIATTTVAINRTTAAVDKTQAIITDLTPTLRQVLVALDTNLQRTDHILATIEPRAGPLQDSLAATLGQTRILLTRLDSLAGSAQTMVAENHTAVQDLMERLQHTGAMLEHFTDQVSRRPTRLITGVTPPAAKDTMHKQSNQ